MMDFEYRKREGTQARVNPSENKKYGIIYGKIKYQVSSKRFKDPPLGSSPKSYMR